MPSVISMVVIGIIFMLILSPSLGLVNPLLDHIGLGKFKHAWLGDPKVALVTIIITYVWKNFGLAMFLIVAGLKDIDVELYEAATIDGANTWDCLFRVTLPLLIPIGGVVVIVTSIEALKVFDLVYVMTNGGPNHTTEVLTTWMYWQGFRYKKMGYGSAIGVVLLTITFILASLQVRFIHRSRGD
jgi:raffinose/stachyose/melibiose transport system permease protein